MNRNEKQKGGSILGLIIIAAIAVVNIFGIVGLMLVIPIIMIGIVFRVISKARLQQSDDGGHMRRAARWPADGQYPLNSRPAIGNLREDNRRRMEELDDLLKAGIIEQAEYHERMTELRNESF